MQTQPLDVESQDLLKILEEQERIKSNRIPGVRTVLVVLSARGVVFDVEALRQKILLAYPDAVVFFRTTSGKSWGAASPDRVDLLIDFTGPGQRQGIFYSRRLRSMARVAVGRNAGFFRKGSYDRVVDEKARAAQLPSDLLARERAVQREVLGLAGVPLALMGDTGADLSHTIALNLPSFKKL